MNTFNSEGQIEGDYVYLDDIQCSMFGCDPGWYTYASVSEWLPVSAGDVIIPFGAGVQIGSDCGAIVTFSGQVAGERTFDINTSDDGGYTWTGNVSPVDAKLKDLAITPPEGGLWGSVSIQINTFNAEGQIEGDYVYLDDVQCSMFGCDPGWYTYASVSEWLPVSAGDITIKAGEMFQIGSDCGGKITVPSPL